MSAAVRRVDALWDAAPRASSRAQDVGPLRAFLSNRPWPYYARPRPELDLSGPGAVTTSDIERAAAVLAESGLAPAFEWIPDLVPSMAGALNASGWSWESVPVLARLADRRAVRLADGVQLRLLGPEGAVGAASAVNEVAFAFAADETCQHNPGPAERDELVRTRAPGADEYARARLATGLNVSVVAVSGHKDGIVGTATLQPIGASAEIVGVAVLPSHRRRGIGSAMTARRSTRPRPPSSPAATF